MTNLKKTITTAYLFAVILFFNSCDTDIKKYTVEVTYCDNRPVEFVICNSVYPPTNSDIYTYKQAVPKWGGRLNVCNLRVISVN